MKYIVFDHKKENPRLKEMVIFCEISEADHELQAEKLGILDRTIAAGFLKFDEQGNIHCGGFSKSLSDRLGRDICSRGEEDEKLFRFHNKMSLGGI
ncbi:hypothetical protein KAR91_01980 [Candidatus Pacearchaeota archaeon]|nr:hypothetical protein [Candidatus Pacearchaeota archaeon]